MTRWPILLVMCLSLSAFLCPAQAAAPVAAARAVQVSYRELLDDTKITHSGRTVGEVLYLLSCATDPSGAEERLQSYEQGMRSLLDDMLKSEILTQEEYDGELKDLVDEVTALRALPQSLGDDPETVHGLSAEAEPFLEPYAFILEDAVATESPDAAHANLIEVATLFPAGAPQPAWADLLRTRRISLYSDGEGYARLFIPGSSAEQAYRAQYPLLRYLLNSLYRSVASPTGLTVDVYAYEHNFAKSTFTLHLPAYRVAVSAPLPAPASLQALNIGDLQAFFSQGLTLAGAGIDQQGRLVLLGTDATHPTLLGEPISLADLAVAYRAVFYSGYNEAYISLDRSDSPARVAVNFGGRLNDTRIGWTVLQSDIRFKTLGTGLDRATGDFIDAEVKKAVPGFSNETERFLNDPRARTIAEESTRYWFYPDSVAISASGDGRLMTIATPRFTAAAEREEAWVSGGGKAAAETPPWTKRCIAHLNDNYGQYAALFPELRELDDVGRLLALCTWLKQQQEKGALRLDLDALLDVELPSCRTPRQQLQTVVEFCAERAQRDKYLAYDASEVTDMYDKHEPLDSESDYKEGLDKISEAAGLLGLLRLSQDRPDILAPDVDVDDLFDAYAVITGGIDLNLGKRLATATSLPDPVVKLLTQLRDGLAGQPVTIGTEQWQRSPEGSSYTPPVPSRPHRPQPVDVWLQQEKGISVVQVSNGATTAVTAPPSADLAAWNLRRDGTVAMGNTSSRTVYGGADAAPARIVRKEGGATYNYHLSPDGEGLQVVLDDTARPIADDLALLNEGFKHGKTVDWAWSVLPEDTSVVALERCADGRYALLRGEGGESVFGLVDGEQVVRSVKGDGALEAYYSVVRDKVAQASQGGKTPVLYVRPDPKADQIVLQLGDKETRCGPSDLDTQLKALLAATPTIIIYRDGLARRVVGREKSPYAGTDYDPVELAASVNSGEYGDGRRAYVDDELDLAQQNLQAIAPIRTRQDVCAVVPEADLGVQDWGAKMTVRPQFQQAGISIVDSFTQIGNAPNVLCLWGHNDEHLAQYLVQMGKQGLLKDRVLLLATCYGESNADLYHTLIADYGAKAVLIHDQRIGTAAFQRVMAQVASLLQEVEQSGQSIDPAELISRAADRALQEPDVAKSPALQDGISKLRRNALQISRRDSSKGALHVS